MHRLHLRIRSVPSYPPLPKSLRHRSYAEGRNRFRPPVNKRLRLLYVQSKLRFRRTIVTTGSHGMDSA